MQRANQARLPSPLALGVGQYPELCFEGQTLGFNVMAVESMETDLSRLGNIFQITPASPEEYLSMVTQSFFDSREVANLLQLFRAAGRTQREYNDNGLIPNDCHAGNYSLTKAGSTILNDFGQGKTKDELTPQQISMLQLLDLRRFLNSIFEMRFYSAGELFLADNNPAQAFLQGYFGKEVYTAHEKEIGNPDQMLRKLDTDKGFISRLKILKFAFEHLYGPLQSVLENEDNQFPLNEQERKEKRIEICRQLINQRKLNQS